MCKLHTTGTAPKGSKTPSIRNLNKAMPGQKCFVYPSALLEREFISQINGGLPDKAFAHRAGHPYLCITTYIVGMHIMHSADLSTDSLQVPTRIGANVLGGRLLSIAGKRHPQATGTMSLLVPNTRTTLGTRSFTVAGPVIWNSLPTALSSPTLSPSTITQHLKAHLFGWLRTSYDTLYKSSRGLWMGRGYPLPQPTRRSGKALQANPVPLPKLNLLKSEGQRSHSVEWISWNILP